MASGPMPTKPSQRAMANSLASRGAWFPSRFAGWEGAWRWPSAGARAPITSRVAVKESSRAWRGRGHARRNACGEEQRSVVCGSSRAARRSYLEIEPTASGETTAATRRAPPPGGRRGAHGVSPRRTEELAARAGRGRLCGVRRVGVGEGLRRVCSSAGTGLTEEGRRRVGAICNDAYGHLEIARARGLVDAYFEDNSFGRLHRARLGEEGFLRRRFVAPDTRSWVRQHRNTTNRAIARARVPCAT